MPSRSNPYALPDDEGADDHHVLLGGEAVSAHRPGRNAEGAPARPDDAWVEVSIEGGWVVAWRIVPEGGRPVVAELRVFMHPKRSLPAGGLSTSLLRRVPAVGDVVSDMFSRLRAYFGDQLFDRDGPVGRQGFTLAGFRPGRRGHSDSELAKLAAQYIRELASGNRAPVKAVAKRNGMDRDAVTRLRSGPVKWWTLITAILASHAI